MILLLHNDQIKFKWTFEMSTDIPFIGIAYAKVIR